VIPYKTIPVIHFASLNIGVAPLMSTIGFVVFGILVAREFKKRKIVFKRNDYLIMILLFVLSSLAGGRIWYFLGEWQGLATISKFFNLFEPGLTSYGMMIGGFVFLIIWIKKKPIKGLNFETQLAKFGDAICLYAPIFIAIYRVGCYFHGCCYGIKTKVPWALHYVGTNINRHPTQIYFIIHAIIVFVLVKIFFGKRKTKKNIFGQRFDGEIALWFLVLYCVGRFLIDFFRYYTNHYLGLALSQWVCLIISLIAVTNLCSGYIKAGD
jgi:phosphatidylglycerol:prolipoprotein diacylglycerol transferase